MKKGFVLQSLICLLAVSCSVHKIDPIDPVPDGDDVFYASLESYSAPETRVYLDGDKKILWNAMDQVSIFNGTTVNQQFEFMGETGVNSGYFKNISEGSGTSSSVNYICAVYPYLESTSLSGSGVLTLSLPAEQIYRHGSFGPGANTMVSTTEKGDDILRFRNVGGYLVFKFWGKGADDSDLLIQSIVLEGRNEEILSGEATWEPVVGATPENITMASTDGKTITLLCNNVKVGSKADKATEFWMVVPPTHFTQGFKVTVTDKDGKVFVKETDENLTIGRNNVSKLSAVQVTCAEPVSD